MSFTFQTEDAWTESGVEGLTRAVTQLVNSSAAMGDAVGHLAERLREIQQQLDKLKGHLVWQKGRSRHVDRE